MTAQSHSPQSGSETNLNKGGLHPFASQTAAHTRHLDFRGRCEEAIAYYKAVLGAEVGVLIRFKDNPQPPPLSGKRSADFGNRILHAELTVPGASLLMSDGITPGPPELPSPPVSLPVHNEAECDRIFKAFAAEGTVQMEAGPTFFAKRFGSVIDKFGVEWMILVPKPH